MQSAKVNSLRTRVYVDGYNFYYGCLKRSAFKWLDLRMLAEQILANVPYERDGEPCTYQFTVPAIKYFTAPILGAFAKSDDSIACQSYYHDALAAHLGEQLEIIKGFHDARRARAYRWDASKPARQCERVEIWKLEEKRTDVALALHAYSDAIRKEVDQVVVVTNDSDFEPAMQMLHQHTSSVLGLISPIRSGATTTNAKLERHAHWVRSHILDEELARSQLPAMVRRAHG